VAEIDTLGTVTQGVVSYNVKINFDTQDARVKPGMSVNAAIITEAKQNVLYVPNSAIKTSGTTYYVLTLDSSQTQPATGGQGVTSSAAPQQVTVEIGSANDTSTEITSGLNEGDQVITRTIAASATQASTSSGLFWILGGNRTSTTGSTGATRQTTTNSARTGNVAF